MHSGGAGLRTHILIAVASALFTILAFEIFHRFHGPDRIGRYCVSGGGAIFRSNGNVQGLTTGAGMWLAGAVGIATALGYYVVAFGVALFAVLVLAALRALAHRVIARQDDTLPKDGRGEK